MNQAGRASIALDITSSHREIWMAAINNPELARVLDENADPAARRISFPEEYFVILVANHMSAVYDAYKQGLHRTYPADMRSFFQLPIPRAVWLKIREFQNPEFADFIDELTEE